MKVFITRKISPIAKSLLKSEGYSVSVFGKDSAISKIVSTLSLGVRKIKPEIIISVDAHPKEAP